MLDTKDFSFFENQTNFDFKGFLFKTASYWKWFLASWIIAFIIAYQVNIRKEKIYGMSNMISVKEETNPLFSGNTNLVFNWGGTSDQVQTISTTLSSRSHNEAVVEKLEFYINYQKQSEYNIVDAYGEVPFYVKIDKRQGQLLGKLISVKFISESVYEISIPFETDNVSLIHYADNSFTNTSVQNEVFTKRYRVGEQVVLPFLNWKLEIIDKPGFYKGKEYFVSFNSFDGTVSSYQGINVNANAQGSSILTLSMQGTNKARLVKYLNTTVEVLRQNQLAAKNQFAENTINFIDSTMYKMEKQLTDNGDELKQFTRDKKLYEIESGGTQIAEKLSAYDLERDGIQRKLAYYDFLKKYLNESVDFSKLPAPSVAGIDDPNIVGNVAKLIQLSAERSEKKYAVKNEKLFQEFDNQMEAVKDVLLENINTAKTAIRYDLDLVNRKIGQAEGSISKLPEEQQELIGIRRKYDLNSAIYNDLLAKKSQADIIKAANVSDIKFIDSAKDIGGGLVGPKTGVNYVLAAFLGFLIPLLFIFGIFFINDSIQNADDLVKLTGLPLIGMIGKKNNQNNLSVFEKPKSTLAESFRAIRSSLQFLYKKQKVNGTKTLMLTSSIGGEGKTFCSINIATVFALSEKKTIIVGLDLRKPKIFDDFKIANDIGAVNYLIGQKTIDEVIQKTSVPFLDVITSGPIPPNPSELIISDAMTEMLEELKKKYDYIILDTPPVGLVSDAVELAGFADVILYIVRQNVTRKGMIMALNNRVKRGELTNVSIVLNGFENKAKYGYGYGGYGNYSAGYLDDEKKNAFSRIKKVIKKKSNKGD